MKIIPLHLLTIVFLVLLLATSCQEDNAILKDKAIDDISGDFGANFSFSHNESDSLTIFFTNLSVGAESYVWNFGNDVTSTEENPEYTYAQEGDYDVTLIITNMDQKDTVIKTVHPYAQHTLKALSYGSLLIVALRNIYITTPAWITQLQQNLIGDIYSGYMMCPTPFQSNSNNMTYNLVDGWNEYPWKYAYNYVMEPLSKVNSISIARNEPEYRALSNIIRVEAMHRISDLYGPIVYSNYGDQKLQYDSQESVYKVFFAELDEAIEILSSLSREMSESTHYEGFVDCDLVYGGNVLSWIKFANSLRLRLAIRISDVDPVFAKENGENSLNNEFGLIESNNENFVLKIQTGSTHPLNVISRGWGDTRMSAEMESILMGYRDPRARKYFEPDGFFAGYHGIRQGIVISSKSDYVGFSALAPLEDVVLMTASEVSFLKAEAALRGWARSGDARSNYEEGIIRSFHQHGAGGLSIYLADAKSVPSDYTDPNNSDNNVSGLDLSTITIAWDESDSFERKLERIITQKWIAMFPDGQEAWSELRRTGYPKKFKVKVNYSGGTISTEEYIKRINFPSSEIENNPSGVASGVSHLGGPDTGGTALWWDVD